MITVKVVKRRWFRGKGGTESRLRKGKTGHQCCIGFLARTIGAKARDIVGLCTLEELSKAEAPRCYDFYRRNISQLGNAYAVNDAQDMTDKARITKLTAIGKKMGVQFRFI